MLLAPVQLGLSPVLPLAMCVFTNLASGYSFFFLSWEPDELLTVAVASLSGQHVVIATICTDPSRPPGLGAEAHAG